MTKNNIQYYFFALIFYLLMVSALFSDVLPSYFGLCDEFAGFLLIIYFILFEIKKRKRIPSIIIFFLVSIFIIGLLGNVIFGYLTDVRLIIQDAFFVFKPYLFLFIPMLTCSSKSANKVFDTIFRDSRIMLVLIAFVGILDFLSLVYLKNYGIYSFFAAISLDLGMWTILFIAVIFLKKDSKRWLYYLCAILVIWFVDSGLATLCVLMLPLVWYFWETKKKLKWYYLVLLIPIGIFIARGEIEEYLINSNAVRNILPYYAIQTANNCFPLGGGFGTYGGNTAMNHYSVLYKKYGFEHIYGMSSDESFFLMDSYYPLVIGQFGYLGCLCFMVLFLFIIKRLILNTNDVQNRCWGVFLYGSLLIAGLGFGTSSNWGCCVYFIIALLYKVNSQNFYRIKDDNRYSYIPYNV